MKKQELDSPKHDVRFNRHLRLHKAFPQPQSGLNSIGVQMFFYFCCWAKLLSTTVLMLFVEKALDLW